MIWVEEYFICFLDIGGIVDHHSYKLSLHEKHNIIFTIFDIYRIFKNHKAMFQWLKLWTELYKL